MFLTPNPFIGFMTASTVCPMCVVKLYAYALPLPAASSFCSTFLSFPMPL